MPATEPSNISKPKGKCQICQLNFCANWIKYMINKYGNDISNNKIHISLNRRMYLSLFLPINSLLQENGKI